HQPVRVGPDCAQSRAEHPAVFPPGIPRFAQARHLRSFFQRPRNTTEFGNDGIRAAPSGGRQIRSGMAAKTLTINGKQISADESATILEAATEAGISIPTLCHLEGVYDVGACRLCLVEVAGIPKLLPACTTKISEGMEIQTDSERLAQYRRITLELLLAERNHVCAVCVANEH